MNNQLCTTYLTFSQRRIAEPEVEGKKEDRGLNWQDAFRIMGTMSRENQLRALSVRQPYAHLILTGKKNIEYRRRSTNIRGKVYIYACKARGPAAAFAEAELEPDDLVYGMLLGTVEIVGCTRGSSCFEWHLANSQPLAQPIAVVGMPQPSFFWPFG